MEPVKERNVRLVLGSDGVERLYIDGNEVLKGISLSTEDVRSKLLESGIIRTEGFSARDYIHTLAAAGLDAKYHIIDSAGRVH